VTHGNTLRYDRDGYVLERLLAPSDVALVLADADRLAAEAAVLTASEGDFNLEAGGGFHGQLQCRPGTQPHGPVRSRPAAPGAVGSHAGVLRKVSNFVSHSPAAARLARCSRISGVAREALGCASVRLEHSILWCKPAGIGSAKPPHQDAPYLSGGADDFVTIWVALDPATPVNGCLRVVPGSHRFALEHTGAEPQVTGAPWTDADVRDVPLDPGHAIVFHPRLLHASGPNHSDLPRRALMLRYTRTTAVSQRGPKP
jgi:hypothetical protein